MSTSFLRNSRLISILSSRIPQRSRAYSQARQLRTVEHPNIRYTRLPSRSLIQVGPNADEARTFLHGLITANTKSLQYTSSSYYSAFLCPSGRVLYDVFIYPPPANFERGSGGLRGHDEPLHHLIEVATERAPELMKHLKRHKLRRKLSFRLLNQEEGPVYGIWTDERNLDPFMTLKPILEPLRSWKLDQRPGMGARCILRPEAEMEQIFGPPNASFENYTVHRMISGIAEGAAEIIPGKALPQESNLDLLGALDFRKGCYLGQELTIRTHHTGIIRKRILPVQLYNGENPKPVHSDVPHYIPDAKLTLPPPEANISKVGGPKGRSAGKWLGGVGNIGLALCRLEMMTDIKLTDESLSYDPGQEFTVGWSSESQPGQLTEVKVKPFVPRWMRLGIEAKQNSDQRKHR